jgi:hypothetical protein
MKCTDEKNISLAEMGYKIFFSSTTLTLNSKPIAGLNTNRKPVVGLTTKNCQLFSGRDTHSVVSPFGRQHKQIFSPLSSLINFCGIKS